MTNPIMLAIKQICEEKGIPQQAVLEAIEQSLAAAYRKDFGEKGQNIEVIFDPEIGQMKIYDIKKVVETTEKTDETGEIKLYVPLTPEEIEERKANMANFPPPISQPPAAGETSPTETEEEILTERRFNPKKDISLEEAKKKNKKAKIGDEIKEKLAVPKEFGRVAAQVAKQVITQRLNEVEKDIIYQDFKEKEGLVVSGTIQRIEPRHIVVDFNRVSGILPLAEQIRSFNYRIGQKIKVYVVSVEKISKGPQINLSHIHPKIVKEAFMTEIPEIQNEIIEIKSIAREAGSRTKIAVESKQENVDPIGSCVGQRGARIQVIISEVGGEKIDIIQYDESPEIFIHNALAPAKISRIELDQNNKTAKVKVKSDQLSLAIGRGGQNVRLAAHLTGWKLAIEEENENEMEKSQEPETEKNENEETKDDSKNQESEKSKVEDKKNTELSKTEAEEKPKTKAKKQKKQ